MSWKWDLRPRTLGGSKNQDPGPLSELGLGTWDIILKVEPETQVPYSTWDTRFRTLKWDLRLRIFIIDGTRDSGQRFLSTQNNHFLICCMLLSAGKSAFQNLKRFQNGKSFMKGISFFIFLGRCSKFEETVKFNSSVDLPWELKAIFSFCLAVKLKDLSVYSMSPWRYFHLIWYKILDPNFESLV